MADLKLVKPERLDPNGVYSEIRNGNCNVANLMSRSGLTRGVVRGMVRDVWGASPPKIKHPRGKAPKGLFTPAKVERAPDSRLSTYAVAIAIVAVALALGGAGVSLNFQYTTSLGQTPLTSAIFGVIGITIDCVTIFVPAAAASFWEQRRGGMWFLSTVLCVVCFFLSVIMAMSFSASNIGDFMQGRDTVIEHRRALNAELTTTENERSKIAENRDPLEIEQTIKNEEGQPRWASSKNCTDITTSSFFCSNLFSLRAAKRAAERRLELDARLRRLNEEIATMAPISCRDCGAEHISWVFWGWIKPEQVEGFLIGGLACMPSLAGLLLMFARKIVQ